MPTGLDQRERFAVNELFDFFARCFRHLWARDHQDEKARYAWAIAIKTAHLTPRQVRCGMAQASQLRAPPTVGEFIQLCRPDLPDPAEALTEAMAWWRGKPIGAEWSHPTVGVAAGDVGPWPMSHLTQRELEQRWRAAYAKAQQRFHGGESLTPPALLLISEDRGQTLPGHVPMQPDTAAKVARLRAELGLEPLP
ncbi:MAG: replication protein P [Lysobacter sp.]